MACTLKLSSIFKIGYNFKTRASSSHALNLLLLLFTCACGILELYLFSLFNELKASRQNSLFINFSINLNTKLDYFLFINCFYYRTIFGILLHYLQG